jgi:ribonuclease HII
MGSVLATATHPDRALNPIVAGVDEAGRGCLAGPVVAACVVLPSGGELPSFVCDSKKLSAAQRERACQWIYRHAPVVAVGLATVDEIEALNILQASLLAMRRAIESSPMTPHRVLIDGPHVPEGLPCPAEAVVNGDERFPLIGAASIVAKVFRDHLMVQLHRLYPQYGFAQHKGYATLHHQRAIVQHGLCPQHRPRFCQNLLRLPLEEGDG